MRTIRYGFVLDVHLVSYTKVMGTTDYLRNTLLCLHPANVKKQNKIISVAKPSPSMETLTNSMHNNRAKIKGYYK